MTKVWFSFGFDVAATPAVEWLGSKKDLVANGVYLATVTSVMKRDTKQCEGCWYWHVTFSIVDGEFKGRSLPVRYNIVNSSHEAEAIGRGQFRHLLDCIGNLTPTSEADLFGIPVLISVETRKTNFTGRNGDEVEADVNEIVRVEPYSLVTSAEPVDDEPEPF